MSDDWDPFADPAEVAAVSQVPANDPPNKHSTPLGEQESVAIDRRICEYGGALPSMPRATSSSSTPLTPKEFAVELKQICEAWDMSVPPKYMSYPDNEDGNHVMALKAKIAGADMDMTARYMSILARRSVSQLEKAQEQKPSSLGMVFAFLAFAGELGCSLSDDCIVVKPSATFSGGVVFVFGYGGSTMADLSDCAPAYQDIDPGCLVVALVFRPATLSGAGQLAFAFEHAINAWADAGITTPKLFIHMHSNLGMMAWKQLLSLWESQVHSPDVNRLRGPVPEMSDVLAGIVFDSCPDAKIPRENSINSIVQAVAAMLSVMNGTDENGDPMDQKEVAKEAFKAKMLSMKGDSMLQKYFATCSDQQIRDATAVSAAEVHDKEPPVPLLFIYSASDNVILASGVEQYIAEVRIRRNAPSIIRQLKLTSSPHCQHRKTQSDKDVYWKAVSDLWQTSMGRDGE